jgi:hypothetical protein
MIASGGDDEAMTSCVISLNLPVVLLDENGVLEVETL